MAILILKLCFSLSLSHIVVLKIADVLCFFAAYLLLPLIHSFLHSHNLEYDSSEEKKPRLIFYNEKDEVVKVRREFGDLLFIRLAMGLIEGAAECQDRFM